MGIVARARFLLLTLSDWLRSAICLPVSVVDNPWGVRTAEIMRTQMQRNADRYGDGSLQC